jgi:hypothetical protein
MDAIALYVENQASYIFHFVSPSIALYIELCAGDNLILDLFA